MGRSYRKRNDKNMTYQEAIEKAAKLLRLATSSNPHEAALAASRAQEIIDRYKLTDVSADLSGSQPDEPIRDFGVDPLDGGKKLDRWRWHLFLGIADGNQCKGYLSARGGIAIVGRPSDANTVRYFYSWLTREVDRLAARDCVGYGRTFWNNYRLGVVETVREKLKSQFAETLAKVKQEATEADALQLGAGSTALVRVNQAVARIERRTEEVNSWVKKNLNLRSSSGSRSSYDPSARAAGRKAGHEIRMRPSAGGIGRGAVGQLN